MSKYATFRELHVWQKGMELSVDVYRLVDQFPPGKRFTLGDQLCRAATSVPANVAEGFGRRSRRAYRAHVAIALGSNAEVQTFLDLCRRLALTAAEVLDRLDGVAREIGRMLYGLWKALGPPVVGYAVTLALFVVGLGPWAVALLHGLPLVP